MPSPGSSSCGESYSYMATIITFVRPSWFNTSSTRWEIIRAPMSSDQSGVLILDCFVVFQNVCFITPQFLYAFFNAFSGQVSILPYRARDGVVFVWGLERQRVEYWSYPRGEENVPSTYPIFVALNIQVSLYISIFSLLSNMFLFLIFPAIISRVFFNVLQHFLHLGAHSSLWDLRTTSEQWNITIQTTTIQVSYPYQWFCFHIWLELLVLVRSFESGFPSLHKFRHASPGE